MDSGSIAIDSSGTLGVPVSLLRRRQPPPSFEGFATGFIQCLKLGDFY
jgi:hypothetical protein